MSDWVEVKREDDKEENSTIWEPEVIGESIEGLYIEKEENVGQFKSNLYSIKTSDEVENKIWGSKVLDGLMENIEIGMEVRITFNGKQPSKTGKNPWKDYKVEFKKP